MPSCLLRRGRFIAALCGFLLATGSAGAADLTVSAAASLTNAFKDIGTDFEAHNPGVHVQFNFAASGALLQQIAKGAPVDVFASADEETMDQAAAYVVASSRADFVRNALVVIVPSDAASVPKQLGDLTAAGYRKIAIGLPASVPVGRYTKAVLEQAKLWAVLEPKTVGAQSVRQALDYVARGEVDAGFVYATDAALLADKVKLAFRVPTERPVSYPLAQIAASAEPELARKFVAYVLSPPAQAVLARYGFMSP